MDSDQVMMNRNNPKLVEQYTSIRDHFVKEQKSDHPIIRCNEIEYVMSGWVSHKPYLWMKKEERDPNKNEDTMKNDDNTLRKGQRERIIYRTNDVDISREDEATRPCQTPCQT